MKRLTLMFALTVMTGLLAIGQSYPPDFDAYAAKVLKTFNVPGISVAIVKDGKVVLAKGYGVKKLGAPDPVDSRTNFGIASNTKAFTATAIAILVEEGKLKWEGRVIDYLPWFQLSDPYVTREMTIRDLLVHRSGLSLGAGDLLWWPPSAYNRKEIARRLRFIPLSTSFRSAYAYDNVLYTVAGEVIEAVSGLRWEDFIKTRIVDKVGMTHSSVRHSDAAAMQGNVAVTHAKVNGKVVPITPFASDNTNPAGGINSNAEDMAKWMICQLDSGKLSDGSRLFSPRTTRQLWGLVTPMGTGNAPAQLAPLKTNFEGYALGFGVRDYRGMKLVSHTGGLPGYVSLVAMIPEIHAGVAVLTNMESSGAFYSIGYHALDYYLGQQFDWIGGFAWAEARGDSITAVAEANISVLRDPASKPSLPLEKYVGTYTDAWYCDVKIEQKNGGLAISMVPTAELSGALEHYQFDTFIAHWNDRELRADAFVTFS
ncbi:MAG TPA: serine hydrolase, partial [Bacteroidota bacterium]|nr:serine hydrolase [Bacteroidota bacterium]